MVDIKQTISVITLDVTRVNTPIKRQLIRLELKKK